MKDKIAFCGLDCEKCDAYLATINDDQALREQTAKKWSDLNGVNILPEQINCEGCRGDGVKTVYCETLCPIRRCAAKKGALSCGDCKGFESCPTLSPILTDSEARNNLKKQKRKAVIYLHGKGGSAAEAAHYEQLFPDCKVIGLEYRATTPWEAKEELPRLFDEIKNDYGEVLLIANSIGAYFALNALSEKDISKAFFISPVTDMERMICDLLGAVGATEGDLFNRKTISTPFGETLSWEYLSYVRSHPIKWRIPTHVLYGEKDPLIALETVTDFARRSAASLTVMPKGEHWFHTPEQMAFLDDWIAKNR